MPCQHESFEANVAVNRMPAVEGGPVRNYSADVTVKCVQCGTPFRFLGLPAGVDFGSPTVSVDACEGRFPILPKGEALSELEGTPIGFSVRKQDTGLLKAAKDLLALMDSVEIDPRLGDETDRVFPRYEFEGLRAAIAREESSAR